MIEIGSSIGRYHILAQLGQGGMATVYKAYDTRLEREVAIKVIRTGAFPPDVLDRILKRFDREAKSLARLNHPNIVSIIDYGEHDGAPYLVMPFYPAGTLKQCLGKPMPPAEAARMLAPIARALAYAHEQGILHRDVKPSNILITGSGEPVLTDFGIAKLLEDDGGATLTGTGVGVGTPEYMAPEQGMGREIDGRADVYGLGVVLYELVTGRKPYTADTPMAVIFKHLTDPLPRPKEYVPDLPDRVEQVIFKAMAKKPDDRYPGMGEFAATLSTIDAQSMVSAVTAGDSLPSSPLDESNVYEEETGEVTVDMDETPIPSPKIAELLRDAAVSPSRQPSPGLVDISPLQVQQGLPEAYADETGDFNTGIASTPQMVKLVATAIVNPVFSSPDKPAVSISEVQKPIVENQSEIFRLPEIPDEKHKTGQSRYPANDWTFLIILTFGIVIISAIFWGIGLSKTPTPSTPEVVPTQNHSNSMLIDVQGNSVIRLGDGKVNQITFSPDGEKFAAASSIGIFLYDTDTLELTCNADTGDNVTSVAFSPDGHRMASGSGDHTIVMRGAESCALQRNLVGHTDDVNSVAFSPDGRRLASGSYDGTIRLWDVSSGALLQTLEGHNSSVISVAFSSDGRRLASGSYQGIIRLWNAESGALLQILKGHQDGVNSVSFSPDGRTLASGSRDKTIILWDAESGALLQTLEGHYYGVAGVAFSPDGRTLASGSSDNTIKLWDAESGTLLKTLEGHTDSVNSVAFSPDGKKLISGSSDGAIRIWNMANR